MELEKALVLVDALANHPKMIPVDKELFLELLVSTPFMILQDFMKSFQKI